MGWCAEGWRHAPLQGEAAARTMAVVAAQHLLALPIPALPTWAGLSHRFRACAAGNVGAPLLLPPGANATQPVQAAVLTSGFACSNDPQVASPSSPALYAWLPRYGDWLHKQLDAIGGASGKRCGDKA